jgi:hypothetical protein
MTPEKLLLRRSTGQAKTAKEWEAITGIPARTLLARYNRCMANEDVFTVSVEDAAVRGRDHWRLNRGSFRSIRTIKAQAKGGR